MDEAAAGDENILDQWITARTEELVDVVTRSLDAYDTVRATRAIQEYIDDLSTWYLRRSRKRKDAGFFKTMRASLLTTSRVLAPFMPFLAEAIYLGTCSRGWRRVGPFGGVAKDNILAVGGRPEENDGKNEGGAGIGERWSRAARGGEDKSPPAACDNEGRGRSRRGIQKDPCRGDQHKRDRLRSGRARMPCSMP